MCGRFFLDARNREIDRLIGELPPHSPPVKLGEIYPTDIALTLVLRNGQIAPETMIWGFPRWDGKGVVFNCRSESAADKPMFASSLRERRAVIPTCGFYEWLEIPGQKQKEKTIFRAPAGEILHLAAIWKNFGMDHGAVPGHFSILTTAANASVLPYHDRMPVVLRPEDTTSWLNGEKTRETLEFAPFELVATKA